MLDLAKKSRKGGREDLRSKGLFSIDAMDKLGMTSVSKAAMGGHSDIVGILLKFGANPRLENSKGETALALACMNENHIICE